MAHAMNCVTVGQVEGFAVKKLRASRDNMKGNSETQHRINGNSNGNGNEVKFWKR